MRNLAGREDCDIYIRAELERCRIPIEKVERDSGEVPFSLIGRLGPIEFRRRWYYYAARGPVPLPIAVALYADPIGKTDIRVDGDVGAPSPAGREQWRTTDGKIVRPVEQKMEWETFAERHGSMAMEMNKYIFSNDPESVGAEQVILLYHIDSEVGLRLFADAVRNRIPAAV